MITTIMFDLDGTLLPMDNDLFTKGYFQLLAKKAAGYGYGAKELVDAIWTGTAAMVTNDGGCTNEDVFWKKFADMFGEEALRDRPMFEDFYQNEFQEARALCGFNPAAKEVVELAKEKGYRVVLATNPIFPAIATKSRIQWAGLKPEDFVLYTTYENIGYCKPNTEYYLELTRRLGCQPEECMMVGNDVSEDMVAGTIGMKVFLLVDHLLNKKGLDTSMYAQGGFKELKDYIRKL